MALVERVVAGGLAQAPEALSNVPAAAGVDAALNELVAQRRHQFLVLLAHSLTKIIRAGGRESRDGAGDLHQLFLIHRHAIGGSGDGLQPRVVKADPAGVALVLRICRDKRHGAGAVQGHQRHEVGELSGPHLAQRIPHARRLKLEHPERITLGEHAVRGRVVQGQRLDVEVFARGLADQPQRVLDDVEVAQPQEVHLQQAEGLHVVVGHLGDHRALVVNTHRQVVGDCTRCDDHAGRVHALVAHQALKRTGNLDDPACAFVGLHIGGQLTTRGERLLQFDADGALGHELGDAIDLPVREAEHTAGVAHDRAGEQLAEGTDASDRVASVLLCDVRHHAVASAHREVGVDIRHRLAAGVEEALKQQSVLKRVEIGDAQRERHQRPSRRSTPRAHRHAILA